MPKRQQKTDHLVVVVDDDKSQRVLFRRWLEINGYEVEVFEDGKSCLNGLKTMLPDAVCLDLHMPGLDGIETLEAIKKHNPHLPVIILTATADVEQVVAAMQRDAYDYLVKPIDRTKLVTTIRNAVEKSDMEVRLVQLQREAEGQGYPNIVGEAPPMRELFRQLDRVAPSDVSVLIHGKSGTGKELVARALHANSGWREGPFVALNCAAIPETLQESELFGHEMGAFTGATSRKMGRFEEAHQGTLFLDEVAELSLTLQAKLLRVLQERVLRRLGGDGDIPSNFRLLAATHRDLAQEVKEGRFREDLFFRIAVFDLDVPSLSERKGDIPLLVEKFVSDFGGGRPIEMAPETMDVLMGYDWPGNIRELQNAIQRAVVAGNLEFLRPDDLPPRIVAQASAANRVSPPAVQGSESQNSQSQPSTTVPPSAGMTASPAKIRPLTELEKEAIEEAWRVTDGNLSEMARQLGLGRTTLYRKIKKYGID